MSCDHPEHQRCQFCGDPDVVMIPNGHPTCLACAPSAYSTDKPTLTVNVMALPARPLADPALERF